jgi:hypothetical protein
MPSTPASSRPDPQTARLVLASCRGLADREEELADRFAAHLGPGVLSGDLTPSELLHSILAAVTSTGDPALIELRWHELGARAAAVGVPAGFEPVGRALVRAVRDLSDEGWSSSISSGWTAFHVWMAEHLTAGAIAADVVISGAVQPANPTDDSAESNYSSTKRSDDRSGVGLSAGPPPQPPGQHPSGGAH